MALVKVTVLAAALKRASRLDSEICAAVKASETVAVSAPTSALPSLSEYVSVICVVASPSSTRSESPVPASTISGLSLSSTVTFTFLTAAWLKSASSLCALWLIA